MRTKLQEKFAEIARKKYSIELSTLLGKPVPVKVFSTLDELDDYRRNTKIADVMFHEIVPQVDGHEIIHRLTVTPDLWFENQAICLFLRFTDDTGFIKMSLFDLLKGSPKLLDKYEVIIASTRDRSFGFLIDIDNGKYEFKFWGMGWERFIEGVLNHLNNDTET